jgi:XTP/dITP diphosphohydrolase
MKLVFATRNRGKLSELRQLVAPLGVEVLSPDDVTLPEVEEDAPTFAGNAEKKARSAHAATGLAALADDSGLEVDALDGAPGVRSARFSGDHDDAGNNRKLLTVLEGVAGEHRTARFRCVLAFIDDQGALNTADGACEGRIGLEARGQGGFGYDPLFLVGDGPRTMAELTSTEKNQVSHRGRAMQRLLPVLEAWARGR